MGPSQVLSRWSLELGSYTSFMVVQVFQEPSVKQLVVLKATLELA